MKAAEAVGEHLLNRTEVGEVLKMRRTALANAIKNGHVPPAIEIVPGQPRWPASTIRELIAKAKEEAGYEQERT